MSHQSEFDRINDPNFVLEIAAGPPTVQLVPQQPGTGPVLSHQFLQEQHKFLFKKAHFSADDTRIFDCKDGTVRAVSTHLGKNPYEVMDPLGLSNNHGAYGEWQSICRVAGYHGMPSLKIRPKTLSRHGKQYIQSYDGRHTHFTVGNVSRLRTMSVRHNLEVTREETDEVEVAILVDMAERTQQYMNAKGERIAQRWEELTLRPLNGPADPRRDAHYHSLTPSPGPNLVTKSLKTLIMNASLGTGSELEIEIAKGVDWTAILAIIMAVKQVGSHFVYDALGNFVANPLQDKVIEAVGLQGVVNQYNQYTNQAANDVRWYQRLYNEFYR